MSTFQDLLHRLLSNQASIVPNGGGAAALTPAPAPIAEPAPEPADWSARYVDWLKLEGYEPNIDADGDIRFKHGDWLLCLMRDRRDAEFFRLVLPNFWSIDNERERARAERAAERVNRKLKVAKVHCGAGKDMWVTAEMFVADQRHVLPVLMRCVRLLPEAAMLFRAMVTAFDE